MKYYEEIFEKYKEKSMKIIEELNSGVYDRVIESLKDRENLINEMKSLNLTKESFNELAKDYKIQETEAEINTLMSSKLEYVKNKINNINQMAKANNSYTSNLYSKSKIFSKKV